MRDSINSRGLERKDDISDELAEFFKYKDELLAILPINCEEKASKYREILKKYLKIDVDKLIKSE
jgi:flagellar biosynthesis GTPase FlhF